MTISTEEFHSDITPMDDEKFLAILTVLSQDWEGEEKGDWDHKLLDQCLYLNDKIDWLESQLLKAAAKEKKHEGKIKWLEKQLNKGFQEK